MAGRQGHIGYFGYVPGRYDQSARIGVFAYLIEHLRYLVDVLAVGCGPGAPLHAIDRAQVALVIGPFVPDGNALLLKPAHIRIATQKPQQFYERSEEHTSELQSLMRISYAVF